MPANCRWQHNRQIAQWHRNITIEPISVASDGRVEHCGREPEHPTSRTLDPECQWVRQNLTRQGAARWFNACSSILQITHQASSGDSKPVSRVSHSRARVQVRRAVWQCMGPAVKTAHRYRICPQLSTKQIAHANHTPRVLSRHRAVVVESCACASMSECATSDGRRAKANRHQSLRAL